MALYAFVDDNKPEIGTREISEHEAFTRAQKEVGFTTFTSIGVTYGETVDKRFLSKIPINPNPIRNFNLEVEIVTITVTLLSLKALSILLL